MYGPVAMAGGLVNGVEHIGLLAVPRQAWENQHCRAGGGFWVGRAGLIVHPVERYLTTINGPDTLTGCSEMKEAGRGTGCNRPYMTIRAWEYILTGRH